MALVLPPSIVDTLSREDWDEALPDLVISSPMSAGPSKVRRVTTAAVRPWALTLQPLTLQQANDLDTFYVTTTAGGALPFEIEHPRIGTVEVQFKPKSPPRFTPLSGQWWKATLALLILP